MKTDTVHLCADDILTREKLVAYHHDSYAKSIEKYGLQSGVRDSEARHTTIAQYYRDLKHQTGKLEAAKTEVKATLVEKIGSLLDSGKIKQYFLYVEKMLPCRNTLSFSERVIQEMCKLKKVRLKSDFYSSEFNRKLPGESAIFSFMKDKDRKEHYHICMNDFPLVQ